MLGLRGDKLAIFLALVGVAITVALAAFTLSGWKSGALWAVALTSLVSAVVYAARAGREAHMAVRNNKFDFRGNKVGTAVKIDTGEGGDFSDNEMKVRVAEGELLDVSGSGSLRRNKFDLARGAPPTADETATRTVKGWSPGFKLPWLKKDEPPA
jgi:hypothetical protein